MSNTYHPTLPPILEEEEQLENTKFPPKNSRRDKKRYKRHIKKYRRAYFKEAVENKSWDTDIFIDDIYDWYFA